MSTPTDAALLAEITAAVAHADAAIKPSQSLGERTKALASKQAWEKAAQMANRVITRGREDYRTQLEEKVAFAREIDATPATASRFTT